MADAAAPGSAPGGPLHIDMVPVPSGGILGLCHCPGRSGVDGQGRSWRRNLAEDLAAIEAWGATTVLTLIESREFASLGVPSFADAVRGYAFAWHHVPIPDMRPPEAQALQAWQASGPAVLAALRRGERVLVHCAAGLGRSGTMAAKLLVEFGVPPLEAIRRVRAARPGTLETAEQEAFVLDSDAWSAEPRG
jgi:ADP-ribosyl-[dinitrogen reductase] hydrolase